MATYEKPGIKFQPPDWFTNSFAISTNSQRQREASEQIRQTNRSMRLAAALRTKWDEFNNTTRLADRIDAIKDMRDILDLAKDQVDEELSLLRIGKDALEEQMQNLQIPKDVVTESLSLRDRRRNIDLVEDAPEVQLKKEKEILEKVTGRLQKKIDEVFEETARLKEARNQLLMDLQDKHAAMDIDIEQYKLRPECPGVSLKPNSTRIPKGTVTPEDWLNHSRYNWQRAQAEIGAGQRLREAVYLALCQSANDLEAQAQATEFAHRRRQHELQQALDELSWQKKQTEDEIQEMERDLDNLESTILSMTPAAKLAQTRLERRTYRPNMELCRDSVQYGLTDEVRQIEVTKEALLEKQRQCRHALQALRQQLNRINDDIALKQATLSIEDKIIEARQQRMDRSKPSAPVDATNMQVIKETGSLIQEPPTAIDRKLVSRLLA